MKTTVYDANKKSWHPSSGKGIQLGSEVARLEIQLYPNFHKFGDKKTLAICHGERCVFAIWRAAALSHGLAV
jgi:hypothetical protein